LTSAGLKRREQAKAVYGKSIDISENTLGAKIVLFAFGIAAFFIIAVIFVLWIMGMSDRR